MQELKSMPPASASYGNDNQNYGMNNTYNMARSAVNYVAYNELANLTNPATAYSNLFTQAAAPDMSYYAAAPRAHDPYYRNLHAQLPLYNEDTLSVTLHFIHSLFFGDPGADAVS